MPDPARRPAGFRPGTKTTAPAFLPLIIKCVRLSRFAPEARAAVAANENCQAGVPSLVRWRCEGGARHTFEKVSPQKETDLPIDRVRRGLDLQPWALDDFGPHSWRRQDKRKPDQRRPGPLGKRLTHRSKGLDRLSHVSHQDGWAFTGRSSSPRRKAWANPSILTSYMKNWP